MSALDPSRSSMRVESARAGDQNAAPASNPQATRRNSILFGALLIPTSLVMAYFWIWRPAIEAQHAGTLSYSMRGVLLPPAFLYFGVALLVTDLRDGQAFRSNGQGKRELTRKGWIFIVGLVFVLGLTIAAWFAWLDSLGFRSL